ncbi:MAG: OmpA family protein [Bacteroidota bacterium]
MLRKSYVLVFLIGMLVLNYNGFSQELNFAEPQLLGPEINTSAEESMPLLSRDGKTLFFVRTFFDENIGGISGGQDIWFSNRLRSGVWGKATNAISELNNDENNAVVGISEDNGRLYLINSYTPHKKRVEGVSFSDYDGAKWSFPVELGVSVKVIAHYGFYVHPNEELLIISMVGVEALGEEDLYIAHKQEDGGWSKPIHLGSVINSTGYETSPFLSEDTKTIYFSTNGRGGYGDADIFKSTRLDDSWQNWSEPENLGANINSSSFDAYFVITEDGEAYFCSNRGGELSDIYYTKIQKETANTLASKNLQLNGKLPNIEDMPLNNIVYFNFDSYEIDNGYLTELDKAADFLKRYPRLFMDIVGHSDDEGEDEYNLYLSIRRGSAIKAYLIEKGIDEFRLRVVGKGEASPLMPNNASDEERQKNRRVEMVYKTE